MNELDNKTYKTVEELFSEFEPKTRLCKIWSCLRYQLPTILQNLFYYKLKWSIQIIFRGYSDPQVWSLNVSIAEYTLPRLKALREIKCGIPLEFENNEEEWDIILGKMIYSLEKVVADDFILNGKFNEEIQEGLDLFGKHFMSLWD